MSIVVLVGKIYGKLYLANQATFHIEHPTNQCRNIYSTWPFELFLNTM